MSNPFATERYIFIEKSILSIEIKPAASLSNKWKLLSLTLSKLELSSAQNQPSKNLRSVYRACKQQQSHFITNTTKAIFFFFFNIA